MEYCHLSLPLNFMLLNNAVGFGGCGVVSGSWLRLCMWLDLRLDVYWTVAVQLHLFLVYPLLLALLHTSVGPERLARTSGILFSLIIPAISLARYASSLARHVTLPLPALGHPDLDPAWIEPILSYFHGPLGYYSTLTRATNFLVGALLGLLPYTFHAFLLHIPVMYWAEAWLAPRGALLRLTLAAPLAGLAALVLAVWCASLAAAAALGALERAVLQPALSRTLAVVGW
ncbi:hypothetical protein F751_6041 [Auxenochlorella protothecoides]|uniref:Uncharacterized protein n=2 Tax=Auxenochlorella protothecoides TaxID=3075 RepID=A0A087SI29_AUXPR|nr:hypothetical protein F751_6041 [Auxenochlorella protothecoides]KFM25383.1 hypothetical protein F751_6041 [Auxenochlorella protothecoides]